jgi:dolichol-phosphate mannosyltransferase
MRFALPKIAFAATMGGIMPDESAALTVSVVLPTYNERDNISRLIEAILDALSEWRTEVIVVDDDSPDGTWQVVQEKGADDPRVRLIRRMGERGLTSAISTGIANAHGALVAWMDCDFSMPPEVLPQLARAVEAGADLALGSRYVPGGRDIGHSWVGLAFSRTINFFASLFLEWTIKDYTSGFVMARRAIFERIKLRGDYGEYCIDLLYRAHRAGLKVREIPYTCQPRHAGESKTATNPWGYIRRGTKYVTTILRLRFLPASDQQ